MMQRSGWTGESGSSNPGITSAKCWIGRWQNWWISDRESYNNGSLSKCNIDALENAEVILIDKPDFAELLKTIPKLKAFIDGLLARSYDAIQNRVIGAISYTAEEKYHHFMTRFPDISHGFSYT